MFVTLSPIRMDATLALHRAGDTLSVNGLAFDLAALPEGGRLPREAVGCDLLVSDVTRTGGRLRLTLLLPHGRDAVPAVTDPQALDLVLDGPVSAPGLVAGAGPGTPGQIAWGQMVTAEAAALAERAAWRAAREISKLDLVLALAGAGLIDPQGAVAAAGGTIPPEFEPVVAAMPPADQLQARVRWAGATAIPRLSPLILAVQAATAMSDEDADALFGWGA